MMISIASLTSATRRLNKLMKDWNDHQLQSLIEQMADADSDKDKLKKLSDGIRDAVEDFLVSLHYRSSANFK